MLGYVLDSVNKSLEFKLAATVATNQIPAVVCYTDITTTATTGGEQDANSNGTNTVTICSAPGASTQRLVKSITIANVDTAAVTVTVQYNNNATIRVLVPAWTLQVGDILQFQDSENWSIIKKNDIKSLKVASGSLTADTDVVAAVAGKRIKVYAYSFISAGTNANSLILKSNGTGGTELWRVPLQSSANINAGANLAVSPPNWLFATVVGEKLTVDVSQTDTVHYSIAYFDDDAV